MLPPSLRSLEGCDHRCGRRTSGPLALIHRTDRDVVLFNVWLSGARLQTFTGFAKVPADLGHPEEADALLSCRDDSDVVATQQLAYGKTKMLQ